MKKGQVVTGVIEKTIFPNKGILYTEEGILKSETEVNNLSKVKSLSTKW